METCTQRIQISLDKRVLVLNSICGMQYIEVGKPFSRCSLCNEISGVCSLFAAVATHALLLPVTAKIVSQRPTWLRRAIMYIL